MSSDRPQFLSRAETLSPQHECSVKRIPSRLPAYPPFSEQRREPLFEQPPTLRPAPNHLPRQRCAHPAPPGAGNDDSVRTWPKILHGTALFFLPVREINS